jgi:uncharacterized protein (TIGR02186 family)
MRRLAFTLLALMALSTPGHAQFILEPNVRVGEGLEIGTSTNEIAITSDFRGADLTVFGALANTDELLLAIGQYDVVVTLEGPRTDATVRKRERLFGIWVNRHSMTFEQPPASYSLASTRSVDQIADASVLNGLGLGVPHVPLTPIGFFSTETSMADFRAAYRRLKLGGGLYQQEAGGVRFVASSLFRAQLRLPANIPDGVHMVRAYLFKSGALVVQKELPLRVVKTGMEQAITTAAHQNPLAYGVFAVMLALVTGWLASLLFRKD